MTPIAKYEHTTFQPTRPAKVFPIRLNVIRSTNATPHAVEIHHRNGTVYISPNDVYISCDRKWVLWEPITPLTLRLGATSYTVAPCYSTGIQLLDSPGMHGRKKLRIGDGDPITSAHMVQRMSTILWNKSTAIGNDHVCGSLVHYRLYPDYLQVSSTETTVQCAAPVCFTLICP